MISVKIECGCGQHYAFDVEPVNGQIASPVACPTCGTDGTAAANAIIASQLPPPPAPPPASAPSAPTGGARLKFSSSGHETPAVPAGVRVDARSLGLVDRPTAEAEARAKISWGETQDNVIKYLMLQGFGAQEATDVVTQLYKERIAGLRVKSIWKIVIGLGMMCVPVLALLPMLHYRVLSFQLLAVPVMIGLYGCWQVLNGIITLLVPKMESGDMAE